ncbi:hypothetical protein SASPL_141197 [Salvia splendens]|uniref:SNARE-complex protein Syntaxin-18 N-terminal domain-containing protein n=1 Tax=Salvia splendens TaxID=180675 RepID=A0A8X8ZCC2_SALSN|nr:hypothetical protein SASPL_141197 [Salvia splendens]
MTKARDRTEDFKDVVRRAALNLGYDESKIAAIMASFIMHKFLERSLFTKAALTTLESIRALEQFLLKHKKDYVDVYRITEKERDSIEHEAKRPHVATIDFSDTYMDNVLAWLFDIASFSDQEVTVFIKACKEQIDVLKNSINNEEENSKGWLGLRSDSSNADTIAHKHGVVLILSEKLHSVTSQFDQLRAVRFREAINRVTPRRKVKQKGSTVAESSTSGSIESSREVSNAETRQKDDGQAEPIRFQQQHLDDETHALQVELATMLDAVQDTETKMVEMSALNHLMSTHVLQQAQQIEFLYEQAVEATNNVVLGNKELSQAIQRNSSSRTFLLLFLFVLIFSVLFLDCYS